MFARHVALAGIVLLAVGDDPAAAQTGHEGHEFGSVHFEISCSADSQQQFDRAVAMLHSFFYPETDKAFKAIAAKEPSCAMAQWGVAISQRPNPLTPPFAPTNLKQGWDAIQTARAATTATPRERDWIEAMAVFFQDYDTVAQRIRTARYTDAMARLHAKYPTDTEASTFYALRDTRTPLRFALVRVALTTVLGYVFAIPLPGWLGLPAAWGAAALVPKKFGIVSSSRAVSLVKNVVFPPSGPVNRGFGRMLAAVDFSIGPSSEIALVGGSEPFLSAYRKRYLPRTVIAAGESDIAVLRGRSAQNGKPTAYVCRNFSCQLPVTDPDALAEQLRERAAVL